MRHIPIYKAEREAGVADQILTKASISCASLAKSVAPFEKNINDKIKANFARATNNGQIDLHYINSILTTIGWNLNDDIFVKKHTWVARSTPEDKPFNFGHDGHDIIGHITGNNIIDMVGNLVDNSLALDEVPDEFHVVTASVLYKYWHNQGTPDKDAIERMQNIIAKINKGEYYVSMEVLFDDFDYGIKDAEGKSYVIARNEESAFLTKKLRAYGGEGTYEGNKIGRVLRGMVFSGKGLVENPGNPNSIIFDSTNAFNKPKLTSLAEFSKVNSGLGYALDDKLNSNLENQRMAADINQADEIKRLENTLTSAIARAEAAEKKLQDMNAQAVQAKLDAFAADIKVRDEKITSLNAQIATEQKSRTEAEEKVKESTKQNTELQSQITKANAEKVRSTRLATIVSELKMVQADAEKFYDSDVADLNLSDERFTKFVTTLKSQKSTVAEQAKKGNDDAAKALENATADKKAPLGTAGVDTNVEQTRANFSNFLRTNCLRRGKVAADSSKGA